MKVEDHQSNALQQMLDYILIKLLHHHPMKEQECMLKHHLIVRFNFYKLNKKYNIEINKERRQKQYWIDRLGEIHKFEGDLSLEYTSLHNEIAAQFYPESNRPTDILMDLGWVMVGSVVHPRPIIHKEPSQAQINKLFELDLYQWLIFQ